MPPNTHDLFNHYYYAPHVQTFTAPGVVSEDVAMNIFLFLMILGGTFMYIMVDLSLHLVLWHIWNWLIIPWWEEQWTLPYQETINTIPNHRKESIMYGGHQGYKAPRFNDVWVNKFIDKTDPLKGRVLVKLPYFEGTVATHEWRWLVSKTEYGWFEKEPPLPPPEPMYYISDGAKDEVDRILSEYNADKNPSKPVEIDDKEAKTADLIKLE